MPAPRPATVPDVSPIPSPRLTLGEAPLRLTRSQEQELVARYAETRSPGLKEEVAETFTPLALALADRYGVGLEIDDGDSATIDDLAEVANLSLLEAIDEFDPALGEPFRSHATPRILGELQRHLREHVWT